MNNEISQMAEAAGIPVDLIHAIIKIESSENQFSWRTEADYRYLWDCKTNTPFRMLTATELNNEKAPKDFTAEVGSRNTEWIGQQASWGPMQIMGGVARELGFRGHFPELCGAAGIEFGVKHLKNLYKRFHDKYGLDGVIAAYNAGSPRLIDGKFSNQEYVNKVNTAMRGA